MDSLFACFVHEIDAQDYLGRDFQSLEDQIQVSLQAGGVADYHDGVRLSGAEKIPGYFFLRRVSHQRIGAGNVHQD